MHSRSNLKGLQQQAAVLFVPVDVNAAAGSNLEAPCCHLPSFRNQVVLHIYVSSPNTSSKEDRYDGNQDIHGNEELGVPLQQN